MAVFPRKNTLRRWALTLAILVAGLTAATAVAVLDAHAVRQAEKARFERLSEKVRDHLHSHLRACGHGLRVAKIAATQHTEVEDARTWFVQDVGAMDIPRELAGALAVGFIRHVPRSGIEAYERQRRDRGEASFAVRTLGDATDLMVIECLWPAHSNDSIIGFDIGSEPRRRAAAEAAMRTGLPTLTSPIDLMDEATPRRGFLYLMPVYHSSAPVTDETERTRAIVGWVYMPLALDGLLQQMAQAADGQLDFDLFDGTDAGTATPIFDADHPYEPVTGPAAESYDAARSFHRHDVIEIGGRRWGIRTSTLPAFDDAAQWHRPWTVLASGLLMTLLATWVAGILTRQRGEAQRLAEQMTASLRQSEAEARKLAMVAARTDNAVVITDARGRIEWVNAGFTRITGYSAEEAMGRKPGELLQGPETDAATVADIRAHVHAGQPVSAEVLNYHKDGRRYWVQVEIQPVTDDQGRITHFMAIESDITQRRNAEQTLRASEARFRGSIEGSLDAYVLLRPVRDSAERIVDFEILQSNWRYQHMLRKAGEQLVGERLTAVVSFVRDTGLMDRYRDVMASGQGMEMEFQIGHGPMTGCWLQQQAVKVGEDLAVTCRDITDRKRDAEAMARLAAIVESSGDGILSMDLQGVVRTWNRGAERVYGYTAAEMIGRGVSMLVPPLLREQQAAAIDRVRRGERVDMLETQRLHKSGRLIDVALTISPLFDDSGAVTGVSGIARDITQDKADEEALRLSEQRWQLAMQANNDGIWDWDLHTGEVFYSARWRSMLGLPASSAAGTMADWTSRLHGDDAARVLSEIQSHLDGRTEVFVSEHRVRHSGGQWVWMLARGMALRDSAGRPCRMVSSHADITQRKLADEALRRAAQTDLLTGLLNRAAFKDRVAKAIETAREQKGRRFAVMFLDFDRFKIINDSLGHSAGDGLLTQVARRIEQCLIQHPGAAAARLGGDEFVVLLDLVENVDHVDHVARELQTMLSAPYAMVGREVHTTASIGIAMGDGSSTGPDDLIRDADTAMYEAKGNGRARHVVFDQDMHDRVAQRLAVESDLRRGLDQRQFLLHYQPIVNLDDGSLVGFEALVRWRHPERGMIPPLDFIPIAEETGLIVPLGQWVLEETARQLRAWRDQFPQHGPIWISANLAPRQLDDPALPARIKAILDQHRLSTADLKLEVTESAFMQELKNTTGVLKQLRDMGLRLDMDDFGTGYSSLSSLHHFPLGGLKIDRAFIQNMSERVEYSAVVHAIVQLSHNLGIRVTAEGIEHPEQVAQLQALECDYAQGYHFAKPMTADAATAYLEKSKALRLSA